jgi:hypothetical protein
MALGMAPLAPVAPTGSLWITLSHLAQVAPLTRRGSLLSHFLGITCCQVSDCNSDPPFAGASFSLRLAYVPSSVSLS